MEITERELEVFGERFIVAFEACRRLLVLYPPNHPTVAAHLKKFLDNLKELRARAGEAVINFAKGEFFVNGVAIKKLSVTYKKNIANWEALGIGLIRFSEDMTLDSILDFLRIVGRSKEDLDARGGLLEVLEQARIKGIHAAQVVVGVSAEQIVTVAGIAANQAEAVPEEDASPETAQEAFERFESALDGLSSVVDSIPPLARQPVWLMGAFCQAVESRLLHRGAVRRLAERLREHHQPSYQHAQNGAVIAMVLGAAIGLGREQLRLLGEAALLRDMGKLDLSPSVLEIGADDEEAEAHFRRHPVLGAELLLSSHGIDATAAIVALEHHAGYDLGGYPALKAINAQHPFSRIVAVASEYDRMTGGDGRTEALSAAEAAAKIVKGVGAAFDPGAVRAFMRVVGCVPEGTGVVLRDGRMGVVAGVGRTSWLAPQVAVLRDSQGAEVTPSIVDTDELAQPGHGPIAGLRELTREDIDRLEPLRDLE